MSYLDPPRFSFLGTFTATPSTINNSTENYPLGTPYNDEPPSSMNRQSRWWNQWGLAFFTVPAATVNGACLEVGTPITDHAGDSLIGAQVTSVATGRAPGHQARLVDLDPDQQARSMIVGMGLRIATGDGCILKGTVAPMCIADVWGRVLGAGGGGSINSAGCMYQSVLENLSWEGIESTSSKVLQELHRVSAQTLSIKFNVDAYNGIPGDPDFSKGRIAGTIGPYGTIAAGVPEPRHVVAKRRIWTGGVGVAPHSPLNPAPFQHQLATGYITIDLGNSIPTVPAAQNPQLAGDFAELGPVDLAMGGSGRGSQILGSVFSTAAEFAAAYQTSAGIFDVKLVPLAQGLVGNLPVGLQIGPSSLQAFGNQMSAQQVRQAKEGLLVQGVAGTAIDAATIALAENADGSFAALDLTVVRLAKDAPAWPASPTGAETTSDAKVPLYATIFGEPAKNGQLQVRTAFNAYQFVNDQGMTDWINNQPASAVTPAPLGYVGPPPPPPLPPSIATVSLDQHGVGSLDVKANGLTQAEIAAVQDNRRALPCQLYFYDHDWSMDGLQPLTALVFVDDPGPQNPTWTHDVGPIFAQYAQLYPGMKGILDLGDYATVKANADRFRLVMNLPPTDPGMMPVTRDLAPQQLAMINRWFDNPLY